MDRTTRIFALLLLAAIAGVIAVSLHQDPRRAELNRMLAANPELSAYPYHFRVLRLEGDTAVMGTPRSQAVPVARILGLLHPEVAGLDPESPEFQAAQHQLATHQQLARRLVLEHPGITDARWELDREWLRAHGVGVP